MVSLRILQSLLATFRTEANSCSATRSRLSFFFSSRRRHTRLTYDWSSDVCSSDLAFQAAEIHFGQLDRFHLLRTNELGELRDRPECSVFEILRARHGDWLAGTEWMARAVDLHQIGRASCRERGEDWVGAGSLDRKK